MNEIRFKFYCKHLDDVEINSIFNKIGSLLNFQLDESYNPYFRKNEHPYVLIDFSKQHNIDDEINSFLKFSFDEIINVPLYKFLLLRTDEQLIVLTTIHYSLFDYKSINHIYKLFNHINDSHIGVMESNSIDDSRYFTNFEKNYFNLKNFSHNIFIDDEKLNSFNNEYTIPFKIKLNNKHSIEDIKNVLYKLFDVYPILSAKIMDNNKQLFSFDGKPSIKIGINENINSFVRPFDLDDCLSRFLIVEDGDDYQLFAVFHHIIFDALSDRIFKQDLLRILDGESVEFDGSFLKVSAFSQQVQNSEKFVEAKQFYGAMLADVEETSSLLDDVITEGKGSYSLDLNLDSLKLQEFLDKNNVNENVLFTSVFAYTLSRFTGSEKVLFNIVEYGRDRFNNLDAIGMFVNTLPVLFDCKNQKISSFMKYSANLVYGVMKHNHYPFRLLANEYNLNPDIIFQYIPDWIGNNNNQGEDAIDDITIVTNDLVCDVTQKDNKYELNIAHSDKYSLQTIKSIAKTYNLILQEMFSVEELSNINYITDSEANLLDSFNQTEHNLAYKNLLDAFNDNLSKFPNKKLILGDDGSYSFAEGAYFINKIKSILIQNNIGPNDKVSVFVDRNHWVLFSNMAVLSLGGTYVPIDENHPSSRIKYVIEKSESKAIITTDTFQEYVDEIINGLDIKPVIINISDLSDDAGESNKIDYDFISDVSCILFTSGTTGNPKAVQIGSRSIYNMVECYAHNTRFEKDDVYAVFASIGFDVSLQHYVSILKGGSVTWVPNDVRLDIYKLNNYFMKYGVTHTIITTQVSKLFVENIEKTSLKNLSAAGEKMGRITPPKSYKFLDAYGPTEATSTMTSIEVVNKIDESSVGFVDWNTKIYILDNEHRRVPFGAAGELYISGYQVSKGYLNNPSENKKVFIKNPFDGEKDGYEIMYKTGDRVHYLPDGSIGFIGRNDSQVKIRGNRVELLEIEATIRELDFIKDVTVQTMENGANNELVAYIVGFDDLNDDKIRDGVCEYVGNHKPEYMVPSYVVCLDKIPLNVNGKVDKQALPKVDIGSLSAEYVAPTTETERKIVEAFKYAFNLNYVGINDDFVHLGGDSLIAIKLNSYLKEYDIALADLFTFRTPKVIADNISKETFDLDMYSLDTGCALSEPQLNVYLDTIAHNKFDSYNIPLFMNISKKYSLDEIYDALNKMFDAHPILRMGVSDKYDVPYLVKRNKPQITIKPNVENKSVNEFLTMKFDLDDCLSRFLIVEDGDDYQLFAVFHHIIFDALSDRIFKQDLLRILDGESVEFDGSFLKVSAFSQQVQNSEKFVEAKQFYGAMLADVEETSSLLDDVITEGKGSYSLDLNLDSLKLQEFLDKNNVNENVLFTSVFAYTLSRFTGSEKVLFNIVEYGRDRFNNLDAIGMFVNTLPVLFDCKNQKISSFMKYSANLVYGVMKHNYYPFRLLANEYEINSNVIFQYIPDWIGNNNDQGEDAIDDITIVTNDLVCDVTQKDNKYELNIMHSDKYSLQTIKSIAKTYNLILQEMFSVGELSNINYISDSEINLLNSFNQTETLFESGDMLNVFNDNLAEYEDKLLVGYEDTCYTHGEGAFIINKLANKLKNLNVKKQEFIGLFVPRSEWFLLASMGVLSLGAIYVPIDVTYPDDRIQFMLTDTNAKVVLVSDETEKHIAKIIAENDFDIEILNVSRILDEDIGSSTEINTIEYNNQDIACVLYTSGTTGVPKGVLITREAVNNFIYWYVQETEFTSEDVYGMHCSYVFDIHTAALYSPVVTGGGLYVVPENIRLNLKALNDYYVEHNCTHTYITSQVGKLFAESGMKTTIKLLCFGGMKLGELNAPDSIGPFESYGPSENLAISTSIFANKRMHSSSIGRFISNVKGYVLDSERRRVPFGAVGELYLSGHQLTKGYLNRDKENNESFFENPFDNKKGYERIYSTGDFVRFLPDGTLAIIGRRDSQVKIRGNRVELSEVESVIRNMDIIKDVTVQTVNNNGNNELVAYVVLFNENFNDDLRNIVCDYVNNHKPNYMVPSYVVKLENIPLNVNGKVDKQALPKVDINGLSAEYVAPTTETEKIIVDIWEDILEFNPIGINDNFYHLGGDSIKAIRIISKLNQKGYSIQQEQLMLYPTPNQLAEHIKVIDNEITDGSVINGFVELGPIQNYFLNRNLQDPHHYNQSILLEVNELDVIWLKKAFNIITKQHPMLRTIFKGNLQYIQKYESDKHFTFEEYEITDIDDINIISNEIQSSFDLENGPLMKLAMFHMENKNYLLIVIHHLVVDGVSWRIILNDLESLKEDINANISEYTTFKDWVYELKEYTNSINDVEKSYWKNIQKHIALSSSKPNLIKTSKLILDTKITNDLIYNVNTKLNTNVRDILLSSFLQSIKEVFNRNNFVITLEGHGREQINNVNITQTIGWFTSIYPVLFENITDNIEKNLINTKETIRKVPKNGLNYQLLYPDFNKLPKIVFNYLGTFKNENSFKISNIPHGDEISSKNIQEEVISIDATNNNNQIYLDIIFNSFLVNNDEIELLKSKWKENIENTITFLKNSNQIYTPSDLGELSLEFSEFSKLLNKYGGNIGSICRLTSLQERMVNYQKHNAHAYRIQEIMHVPKVFDKEIVDETLNILTQKFEILKSQIDFEFKPRLIILKSQKIECHYHEFINQSQIWELSKKDLEKGFKLDTDSLLRLTFIKAEDSTYIIWSMSHIITEGWSFYLLIDEFFNIYEAIENKKEHLIDSQMPLRYYLNELENKNINESLSFWKEHLKDYNSNTIIPPQKVNKNEVKVESENLILNSDVFNEIELYCRKNEITLNSFMETVWTKILCKINKTSDIEYAKVVSGRNQIPSEFNTDSQVGMYLNIIPQRVNNKDNYSFLNLAKLIQKQAFEAQKHDYVSLYEIERNVKTNLTNTLFIFENYHYNDENNFESINFYEEWQFPIVCEIELGKTMNILIEYHSNIYSKKQICALLDLFNEIINEVI